MMGMLVAASLAVQGSAFAGLLGPVDDALYIAGLRRTDLRAARPLAAGNPAAVAIHSDPIKGIDALSGLAGDFESRRTSGLLSLIRSGIFGDLALPSGTRSEVEFDLPAAIPYSARQFVVRIARFVAEANDEVRSAISGLSSGEKRDLIEGLPRFAVDPSLKDFEFVSRPMPTWERMRQLVAKVDLRQIRQAAERLSAQIEAEIHGGIPASFEGKYKCFTGGLTIVVAGQGDDIHDDRDAQLTIDFGGNDRYLGRHGAGIGYASVGIDLGGDDTYVVPDLSLGAGILGIGEFWDCGGYDRVEAGSLALGSGVAGVGMFSSTGTPARPGLDEGPNGPDMIRSESLSQGFGLYGIGLMVRRGSGSHFEARYLSQGAALTGGVGAMLAEGGGDTLVAAGLAPTLESDEALRSFAQGFGGRVGQDPQEAGGVGILVLAGKGGRTLQAGAESQGCGIDGGIGIVREAGGPGLFSAGVASQGYGGNQGVGLFFGGGDADAYLAPSLAQGAGTESGIGLLLEAGGDDLYDVRSGPNCQASGGALGLLLDRDGDDRYVGGGPVPIDGRFDRSLALRMDFADGGSIATPIGLPGFRATPPGRIEADLGAKRTEVGEPAATTLDPPRAQGGLDSIGRSIREASGLAPYATRRMRLQSRKDLAARPTAAVEWLSSTAAHRPLREAEVRLLSELSRESPELKLKVVALAEDANARVAAASLAVIEEGAFSEGRAAVLKSLSRPGTETSAARAAVRLDLKEAAGDLMLQCAANDPDVRRDAATALAALGGSESLSTAQVLLGNPDPFVRRSAAELIGNVGLSDLSTLKGLLDGDETIARAAMMALGQIGSPPALNILGEKLDDTRVGIKIEALRQLDGRCPRAFRDRIDARRNDADRRVRLVASGIDPGRG